MKKKVCNSWIQISDDCWQKCSGMLRLLCRNVRRVTFQLWFWIHLKGNLQHTGIKPYIYLTHMHTYIRRVRQFPRLIGASPEDECCYTEVGWIRMGEKSAVFWHHLLFHHSKCSSLAEVSVKQLVGQNTSTVWREGAAPAGGSAAEADALNWVLRHHISNGSCIKDRVPCQLSGVCGKRELKIHLLGLESSGEILREVNECRRWTNTVHFSAVL